MEIINKKYFGKRVQLARKEMQLTGDQLSELCGINSVYLRKIESGNKIPSMSVFMKICQTLNVSPNYLLAETLEENKIQNPEILADLLNTATPNQIKLITAMVQAALKTIEES